MKKKVPFPRNFFAKNQMGRNSMSSTISNMSELILDFFGKMAHKVSKSCGFTKRESKLTGEIFSSALVLSFINNPKSSLEDVCKLLKKKRIKITKQGLHERFNVTSVSFMEQLFKECSNKFKDKSANLIELLKPFQSVNILDSFKKIQSEEGYFISRFFKKTLVFTGDGKEFDLLFALKKADLKFECDVYIEKKAVS